MGKTFTSWTKIKKGQKIRIISTKFGTDTRYPLNKTLTTRKGGAGYSTVIYDIIEGCGRWYLYAKDCELVEESIEEMQNDLQDLKSNRKKALDNINKQFNEKESDLESKIKFCKEAGIESYDEDTFKVYKTLAILKESSTDAEKAKVIAALIKK